jgi:hypothetical protein
MWLIAVFLLVLSATIFNGNNGITSAASAGSSSASCRGPGVVRLAGARWQNEEFVVHVARVLQSEGVVNKR